MVDERDLGNSVTFEIWAGKNRSICLKLIISQQGCRGGWIRMPQPHIHTSNIPRRTTQCRASIWDVMSLLTRREFSVEISCTANTLWELEPTRFRKESSLFDSRCHTRSGVHTAQSLRSSDKECALMPRKRR